MVSGEKTVTVSPGTQSGLFNTVGRLDPHSYRPNEFCTNNFVYEGLVYYGEDGRVEPALATSWETSTEGDGEVFRFTLREGVTFHDGGEWNCAVARLNFDHFFARALRGPNWHGWYGLPGALDSWECDGEVFVLKTKQPYYPLLQELTYIRPTRMLSPKAFVGGMDSDPITQNTCPPGWNGENGKIVEGDDEVTCVGTLAVAGTGPFKLGERTPGKEENQDDQVDFLKFDDYWGGAPDIEVLRVVRYDTHDDVKNALLDGSLDAVVGAGPLAPNDIGSFVYDPGFDVMHSDPTQNTVLIMNIENDDVRKTVVHGVNKGAIIDAQLGGFEKAVGQLFPESAPYCGIDLTPKFNYDLEKAELISCGGAAPEPPTVAPPTPSPPTPSPPTPGPPTPSPRGKKKKSSSNNNGAFVGLFVAAAVLAVLLCGCMAYMASREKAGQPVFAAKTTTHNPVVVEDKV